MSSEKTPAKALIVAISDWDAARSNYVQRMNGISAKKEMAMSAEKTAAEEALIVAALELDVSFKDMGRAAASLGEGTSPTEFFDRQAHHKTKHVAYFTALDAVKKERGHE